MTARIIVDGSRSPFSEDALTRLRQQFGAQGRYKEVWAETPDGQAMCALVNGDSGWLMYLREPSDAGFSSRNPDYAGPEEATQEYYLSNGQCDEYPLSWTLPLVEVQRVMEHFVVEAAPAPWICWHNDADDGEVR